MITLLAAGDPGYPDDYLVARIRGRRAERRLRLEGAKSAPAASLLSGGEEIAREHEAEVRWLYRQMGEKSRKQLAPLFVLFELRLFIHWLRLAQEPQGGERWHDRFFSPSLWDKAILRGWGRRGAAPERLALLEERILALAPAGKTPTRQDSATGLAAAERRLTGAVLRHGTASGSALVRELCRALIDFSNISAILKSWLWRLPAPPPLLPAGQLSPEQLARIWRDGDSRPLGLPASAANAALTPERIAALAEEKKKALWREVHKNARHLEPLAVFMDYLHFLEEEAVQRRGQLAYSQEAGGRG